MSSNVPIGGPTGTVAPTPQNTPLTQAPIALGLSRPTVPDISEDNEGEAAGGDGSGDGPSLAGLEQHMLGMVQGKLADLIGKSSGYIESLPDDIKANVEALKGVQVKQTELQNQYKRECLELEKKVRISRVPFDFTDFSRRVHVGGTVVLSLVFLASRSRHLV